MKTKLWKINEQNLNNTNLALYSDFISKNYNINFGRDFDKIWRWSVENSKDFWKSIWDFTKIKGSQGKIHLKQSNIFFKNKFFPDGKINYADASHFTLQGGKIFLNRFVNNNDLR